MSTTTETLNDERYISLETFKKDGTGVKTPVWFATLGDRIYVFTDGTSYKVKRIGRDPRARVAACSADGKKIRSAWFDAKAELLAGGPEEESAYRALRDKYGFQMKLLDIGSRLAGRIGRRKVIRLSAS